MCGCNVCVCASVRALVLCGECGCGVGVCTGPVCDECVHVVCNVCECAVVCVLCACVCV